MKKHSKEFLLNDFENGVYITKSKFLKLANSLISFLKKDDLKYCKVYALNLKNDLNFSLYFFSLLFLGKKIIPNFQNNKKIIRRNFKNICLIEDDKLIFGKKNLYFNALLLTNQNIKIIYQKINLKSKIITFSSGTTNKPKIIYQKISKLIKNGENFSKHIGLKKKSTFLNFLPINYMGGYYNSLLLSFINNSKIIFLKKINLDFLKNIEKIINLYNVNVMWSSPGLAKFITDRKIKNLQKKIKFFLIGMDHVSENLKKSFIKNYKFKPLASYGMSETSFISSETKKKTIGNVGKILKNVKVKIEKKFNSRIGEILVKTPYIQKCSENKFSKGWFRTGDLGKIHNDYSLSILGRKKNIIIKEGKNINPFYIEQLTKKDNSIDEAAIIDHKSEFVHKIILFVKIKKNKKFNFYFLKKILLENLDKSFIPDEIYKVKFFEKTISGKIIKNKLKDLYEKKYLS